MKINIGRTFDQDYQPFGCNKQALPKKQAMEIKAIK